MRAGAGAGGGHDPPLKLLLAQSRCCLCVLFLCFIFIYFQPGLWFDHSNNRAVNYFSSLVRLTLGRMSMNELFMFFYSLFMFFASQLDNNTIARTFSLLLHVESIFVLPPSVVV